MLKPIVSDFGFGTPSLDAVQLFQPSPITPISTVELSVDKDGSVCTAFVNDVYMLFNQQRLNLIGKDNVDAWLSSLQSSNSSSSPKLSDEELMQFVKSRHIQSVSELQAYARYITSMLPSDEVVNDAPVDNSVVDAPSSSDENQPA